MRVRIKFSKTGAMKYVGHLDVMRYFQKAIRRAEIPAALTDGFHPHMRMSFAAPLGVGVTSQAEYFDLDLENGPAPENLVERLNREMTPGFHVQCAVQVPEEKGAKGMSQVAAADYRVTLSNRRDMRMDRLFQQIPLFLGATSLPVIRKTKRGEKEVDIRPLIHCLRAEQEGIFLRLSAGSVNNLKPEIVVAAMAERAGIRVERWELQIERCEVYALGSGGELRTLADLGVEIA